MSALDNLLDNQEQICYVQCGFCTTLLLVSVPCTSLSMVVTVRCGHCTSILSVNMMNACLLPFHLQEQMVQPKWEFCSGGVVADNKLAATKCCPSLCFSSDEEDDQDFLHDFNQVTHKRKTPEKKQRAPSAYNNFIKEEIKRLKIEYPNMTHKQAFSAASKNWAHCPQSNYKVGEVHGCGEGNKGMAIQSSDIDNEVHCFGNGLHETKALMRQSICPKSPFLLKESISRAMAN